jgi:hypothetical protein
MGQTILGVLLIIALLVAALGQLSFRHILLAMVGAAMARISMIWKERNSPSCEAGVGFGILGLVVLAWGIYKAGISTIFSVEKLIALRISGLVEAIFFGFALVFMGLSMVVSRVLTANVDALED